MTKEVTKYVPISGMRIVVEAPKTYTFVHWDDYERLRDALRGLSNMYSRTWDRVDGALMMMPDNIERFEKAHAAAQSALGEPVDGDAHEPLERRGFVSDELFVIARDCPMSADTRRKLQALCPRIGGLEAFKMHAEKPEVDANLASRDAMSEMRALLQELLDDGVNHSLDEGDTNIRERIESALAKPPASRT